MFSSHSVRWFAVIAGALFVALTSFATDLSAIEQRIAQRAPVIEKLKAKKLLGENNRGYLEARGSLIEEYENVMALENADRAVVYQTTAGQKGMRMEAVGRDRAHEIAEEAKHGTWVQDEDGQWYEKE